jgi:hypothetical protein
VSCHSPTDAANQRRVPAGQLDLTNEPSDQDQLVMTSFRELLFTDNAQVLNMGALIDQLVPGPIDPVTGQPTLVPAIVQPSMSGGGANASARFFSRFAPGGTHYDAAAQRPWLDPAELRLVAEWLDLGGQYYNDPFNPTGGVRSLNGLSEQSFTTNVLPVLQANCVSCHQPGMGFQRNRFILTGNPEGDFNVTLTMINNACVASANPLLARPSTVPHPNGATGQTAPVLAVGSAGYTAIANWIATACN